MVFAITDGQLRAVHRPTYQAPTALRLTDDLSQDYAAIYRAQPSVRVVVDFLARNIAQLALHTFRREGDNDRSRLRDHPVAQLFGEPNPYTTPYRLWRDLVSDLGIYDRALWVKTHRKDGQPSLVRMPPRMWRIDDNDNWLAPSRFIIKGSRGEFPVDADRAVYFRGYNPEDERHGLSPIESLRRALVEEHAASTMREQTLRNGARASGYIQRPREAPAWSPEAARRFKEGWRQQYSGWSATEGGGTPVLEDGMEFVAASHNAVDLQYVEARKLTREEVAAAYFIPPPMVGILDHATFSNIQEQHKMLYQDTLGPRLREIQDEIKLQILPDFDDIDGVYCEFNLEEKLRGSFEEQASRLQTSVGAPYMTRNEARARANLPRVEGGDELIVPLNVLEGGQASPTDSAPPPKQVGSGLRVKVGPSESQKDRLRTMLREFFARQRREVLSAIGASEDTWWNEERWNDELTEDLLTLALLVTSSVGRAQLRKLGIDPDEYDVDRTQEWLEVVTRSNAESINAATRIRVEEVLADESVEDPLAEVGHVYEVAESARSLQAAGTLATALAGFAAVEAIQQVRGEREATKTWIVTSRNPRDSHARMNGETVPIDEVFSNGAKWPGDIAALGVDEVAGCECLVEMDFPD